MREHRLAQIREVAEYDLDGILLCPRTHSHQGMHKAQIPHLDQGPFGAAPYGFNEPIVARYQRLYGIDIRREPFAVERWDRVKGEFLTLFFKEAKAILQRKGQQLIIGVPFGNRIPTTPLTIHLDLESWARKGIADGLILGSGYDLYDLGWEPVAQHLNQVRAATAQGIPVYAWVRLWDWSNRFPGDTKPPAAVARIARKVQELGLTAPPGTRPGISPPMGCGRPSRGSIKQVTKQDLPPKTGGEQLPRKSESRCAQVRFVVARKWRRKYSLVCGEGQEMTGWFRCIGVVILFIVLLSGAASAADLVVLFQGQAKDQFVMEEILAQYEAEYGVEVDLIFTGTSWNALYERFLILSLSGVPIDVVKLDKDWKVNGDEELLLDLRKLAAEYEVELDFNAYYPQTLEFFSLGMPSMVCPSVSSRWSCTTTSSFSPTMPSSPRPPTGNRNVGIGMNLWQPPSSLPRT